MPGVRLRNPAGAYGAVVNTDPVLVEVTNNSGGTLQQGDLVVIDATGVLATTSATANVKTVLGVVNTTGDAQTDNTTIPAGGTMRVAVGGVARIQIGANAVAVGDILAQSGTVKQAVTNNAATVGQAIAIALEASGAKDANNTIRAIIGKM
jgi:hypothetical protein